MQKQRPQPPKQKTVIDWGDLVARHSTTLVKLGGLGVLVCLGYYFYAVYGGDLLSSPDVGRAYYLVSTFGQALTISAFVCALGLVLLTLDELAYSVLVAIGGLGLMFGIPFMVASNLGNVTGDLQRVTERMSRSGSEAGTAVLFVVALRILYELYVQIKEAPERRRKRIEKEESEDTGVLKKHKTIKPPTAFSPCWELPFCHDRIREICPAYKARRSCWRYGSGCNCDPRLIERLIRAGSTAKGPRSDVQKAREGAYIRSDLEADVPSIEKVQRTIPCSKCPIFAEHQRLKFKVVIPMAILATVVIMGFLYTPVTDAWDVVAQKIVNIAANVALGDVKAQDWFGYLQDDVIRVAFFILLSLLALSYVLKYTEWLVLQKKWL